MHGLAVLGALHGPEDPDGGGLVGAAGQAAELEGQARLVPALVVDEEGVLADVGHRDHADGPSGSWTTPCSCSAPKRMGWPWTSGIRLSARTSLPVIFSKAPSLKTLQFW